MRRWPWLWIMVGCGGGDAEPPAAVTEPDAEPLPYIVPEGVTTPPDVDLAAVEAALQQTLDDLLGLHAVPVREAYDAVMATQDDRCPYYYSTPDGVYWYDDCVAESGSQFAGYVFAYSEVGGVDPYYGLPMDTWSAFGAATVVDAAGRIMELGGSAYLATLYGEGYTTYTSFVQGTFVWDGATDGWLTTGVAPDLLLYGYSVDGLDERFMFVDGGLSGLDGGWAIAFADNSLSGPVIGGVSCGTEIVGTVGVRSPDGVWVDVVFDGEDGGCDGCGAAWVGGSPVGEVCVDAGALVDWGVSPW